MIKNFQTAISALRSANEKVESESAAYLASRSPGKLDGQLIAIVVLATVIISILEYFGGSTQWKSLETPLGWFIKEPMELLNSVFRAGEYSRLSRLAYWSISTFIGYMVIPILFLKLVLRQRLRDFGLSLKGALKHWWIYIGLYLIVLPAVYMVSFTASFQKTYPFYEHASRSLFDFFAWQALYALQFMALEFFYRGFLIHGLKNRFGLYAVLVPMIPYCMIHFGKPLPETLGAILAGIALGVLALHTRTIWLGVLIHISVAVTMDFFSLLNQGKIQLF